MSKRGIGNTYVKNLMRAPKPDRGKNMPKFQVFKPNIINQADLLHMPDDDGYKYALVVVDPHNRKTDAVPLKNKESKTVLDAFKKIYSKKGILKEPEKLEVDAGKEFQGTVREYFSKRGVAIRVALPGRHRQQAMVERKNQQIAKPLFERQHEQEHITGEPSTEWVEDLPDVLRDLNARAKPTTKIPTKPICEGKNCELLEIGTQVRRAFDEPRDVTLQKRLPGKFRSTDLRWDPKVRVIKEILIKPGFPPMYLLDGDVGPRKVTPVAYTKNQLQVIPKNEQKPLLSSLRGKAANKYYIEKIVGERTIKGKKYYQIKWYGYEKDKDKTWEPRENLIKDAPKIVEQYEKNK